MSGIHPTAVIDPGARLGSNVSVGPYAIIGHDCVIGNDCVIDAHVKIAPYTTIGSNTIASNDDRVQFLASFGWEVVSSPAQTGQVRIPAESSEVFSRYNDLQKSQGYDLSDYQGKTVMRYVYKIKNYPGATEPVYATLLISNNRIIGGDITDTSATGVIQGFEKGEISS